MRRTNRVGNPLANNRCLLRLYGHGLKLHPSTETIATYMFTEIKRLFFAAGFALLPQLGPADAEPGEDGEYGRGAIPLANEDFERLPKGTTYRAFLPEHVDLSSRFPIPGSQGRQGSCVGWAVGYAARAYYVEKNESRSVKNAANIPSPAYIYNSIKDSNKGCDAGSRIVDALDLLKTKGTRSHKDYPYNQNRCSPPVGSVETREQDFLIEDWSAINFRNIDQVKGELKNGNPVVVSLRTPREFDRLKAGQTYKTIGGRESSWHAIVVVGYDERRQALKMINSWGTTWADRGFGWISYDAFRSEVREAYVMRPNRPSKPVPIEPPPEIVNVNPLQVVHPPQPPIDPPRLIVRPNIEQPKMMDVECGRVRYNANGSEPAISGFVGSYADAQRLSDHAAAIGAQTEITVRPWPQCEALMTLDKALSMSAGLNVKIKSKRGQLQEGDNVTIFVTAPNYPSFLHIAYIQADGSVVNLFQTDNLLLRANSPAAQIVIGGEQGPRITVSPPFGREMVLVLASRSPLFTAPRPLVETERDFLTALRKAVNLKASSSAPDPLVSAGYDALLTTESPQQLDVKSRQ